MTLEPGTLTVDVDGEEFCVVTRGPDADAETRSPVAGFERYPEVIFG